MQGIEFKVDVEPKDNYENAKKLLFETDRAIQALTPQQLQKLCLEFMQYKSIYNLYQMM